jgi:acyl carrier protein
MRESPRTFSEKTWNAVKVVVQQHFNVDENGLTPETRIEEDLGADSLAKTELIMAFEAVFKCKIPSEVAGRIRRLADAATYMESKTSAEDVRARVCSIIMKQLNVTSEQLLSDANLTRDLKADSLDLVEMIMAFEDEFGVQIPDNKAKEINTIEEAVIFLTRNRTK